MLERWRASSFGLRRGDGEPPASVRDRSRAVSYLTPALLLGLTTLLALFSGGFSPEITAAAALVVLATLVLRTAGVPEPFLHLGPAAATAISALFGFAAWSLASARWSEATSRAVLEYDRTLLYLGVLVLFASLGRTTKIARRVAFALVVAFVAVSLAALAPYLLPSRFPLAAGYPRDRLSWPTSYWNATGLLAAMALLGATYVTCASRVGPAARIAAAGCVPVAAAVVWFSSSRGSVLVLVAGAIALVALDRSRRLLTGVPVAVAGAVAAWRVCVLAAELTAEPPTARGVASGEHVAVLLGVAVLGTAILRAGCLPLDRRLDRLGLPRPSARLRGAAAATLVVAAVVAFLAIGGPARVKDGWDRFKSPAEVSSELSPAQRFKQIGNNGRFELYDVAVHRGFAEHPLEGTGVGTFVNTWARYRSSDMSVVDAHSLYLETLSDLGVVGLGLLLVALGTMLTALVRLGWRERGPWALLAALAIGWCVGAAFDWYWEMPAVTLWLFAAGGLALSRQTDTADAVTEASGRSTSTPVRVAGIAVLAALATTPIAIYRSQTALTGAIEAFRAGDCGTTVRRALEAARTMNSRPEPFELLTYCDIRSGRTVLAERTAAAAVKRDPDNWEFHYVLALAQAAGGQDPRPAARAALSRNPRDPRARSAYEAFRSSSPGRWRTVALASPTLVPGRR